VQQRVFAHIMIGGIEISVVDWHHKQNDLKAIRKSVFIDEQHVPKELEWDGQDTVCTHFLAAVNAVPVATARLTPQGQIGRMAVLKDYRGKGVGSRLLATVIDQARHAGYKQVFLHAQVNVIEFYQKHGFSAQGEVFMDAGIAHQTMHLLLGND
jgi:predicted GNAT family N-acyltransferase